MEGVKSITPELSVASQVTLEQLQQAAHEGYQSVLNLRSPNEESFWHEEANQATNLGLHYVNAPVNLTELTEDYTTHVLQCIDEMPKPVLIHCAVSMRATAMALMNLATRQGLTAEQAFEKAREIGFDWDTYPHLKEFFKFYVDKYSTVNQSSTV
jgi:uncharacterized protein (TIGR01244 family)